MIKKGSLFFLIILMLSCTRSSKTTEHVIAIAVDYVVKNLKDTQRSVLEDGSVRIVGKQLTYILSPSKIVLGLIDNDKNEDAIITINSFKGKFPVKTENLILLNTERKFSLVKVIDANMKITEIKNHVIYAEISKNPPDSPIADCPVCKEMVKYQLKDGDLVKID